MKKLLFYLCFPMLLFAWSADRSGKFSPSIERSAAVASDQIIVEENLNIEKINDKQPIQKSHKKHSSVEQIILRTVQTRFQTEDLEATTNYLGDLTKQYNGYIGRMNHTNSTHELVNRMEISIPAEKLDDFLKGLKSQALSTDYTRIEAHDVTEEYFDISSRLKTKKEVLNRYIQILRNRAQSVEEIFSAEEKIRSIQEEIESIQGRIRYMNARAAMSQVHLDIYQKIPKIEKPVVIKENSFFSKIKSSFLNGCSIIQNVIIGLVDIWPLLFILGLIFCFKGNIIRNFHR